MNKTIYLAGRMLLGTGKADAVHPRRFGRGFSGYANGKPGAEPTYKAVCAGGTGFRETVRVTYGPRQGQPGNPTVSVSFP